MQLQLLLYSLSQNTWSVVPDLHPVPWRPTLTPSLIDALFVPCSDSQEGGPGSRSAVWKLPVFLSGPGTSQDEGGLRSRGRPRHRLISLGLLQNGSLFLPHNLLLPQLSLPLACSPVRSPSPPLLQMFRMYVNLTLES